MVKTAVAEDLPTVTGVGSQYPAVTQDQGPAARAITTREAANMTSIAGVDPRTGTPLPPVAKTASSDQVDAIARGAASAAPELASWERTARAAMLDNMAAAVEHHRQDLVAAAASETGFTTTKLEGELTRTVYQLRFFGQVVREGGYLEATIDPAGETPMGPRPDLRRLLLPIGAAAVFGASNFPFAFSVLGGDTASALAAGCPVVAKAHDSHPATSKLSYDVLTEAAHQAHAPAGMLGIVFGLQAGADLVAHPDIRAVGFTGSLAGGKALLDIISGRDEPIPFYGELSSINAVIVTPSAAAARGAKIGSDLVASFTAGAGQMCTKPGVVLVPDNADGQALINAVGVALQGVPAQPLLNERIFTTYEAEIRLLRGHDSLSTIDRPGEHSATGFFADPVVFDIGIADLHGDLVTEIFGPVTVIVRYRPDQVEDATATALRTLPRSLTATLHHGADEPRLVNRLTQIAVPAAGRLIYNGFPTGVAVSWAQNHGGPWPSTNSLHTSVGATAIRRFLRPFTYQDAPQAVLPDELRDNYDQIPRRIDGVLHPAARQ
jgi:NADP-dependent aldehyde dehydrogenase